jgi:hypothetical protein
MEFGLSGTGVMSALAILLSHGNNQGGGDFRFDHRYVGAWAGQRIVITGDYADKGDFSTPDYQNLYAFISTPCSGYTDISLYVRAILQAGDEAYSVLPPLDSSNENQQLTHYLDALGVERIYSYEPVSSAIDKITYQKDTHTFTITFKKGGTYSWYLDENTDGPSLFEAMKNAPSAGRYFQQTLKPLLRGSVQ